MQGNADGFSIVINFIKNVQIVPSMPEWMHLPQSKTTIPGNI